MLFRICWLIVILVITLVAELLCCRAGALFAGPFFLCFYFVVTCNWQLGLAGGIIACVVSEVVLSRSVTALPLLALLVPFAHMWRKNGDRRHAYIQALPAALFGLSYATWFVVGENIVLWPPGFRMATGESVWIIVLSTLCTAIGFPLMIAILDGIASLAKLPVFCRRSIG